jgi:hypothetical protein
MRKNPASLIVVALLSLTLIGCGSTPKVIEIKATPIDVVPLVLPEVDRIQLDDVKFYVVTEDNIEAVLAELREKNYDPVIFGVTDDGYEMMSVNMAKILQLVQQQKAIIIAYGEYYDKQNEAVEENNESAKSQKEAASSLQEEGGGISTNESLLKRLLPW